MEMRMGLFQQQTMRLAMTQELSQAIALLQYSTLELASFLEDKAAENPLISVDRNESMRGAERKPKSGKLADSKNWIEQIGDEKICIEDYLISQLPLHYLNDREMQLLKQLIRNLDDNGYLRISIEQLAAQTNESTEQLEAILDILQSLDPAGTGARNLQECLQLQLERTMAPAFAVEIIANHFLAFADRKWKQIAKELGISLQDIQHIYDFIQTLDPRPCARFSNDQSTYIVPDVAVKIEGGELEIYLTNHSSAKMTLNSPYYRELQSVKDKQVKQFLQEKYQEYQWIARSIEQRLETILNVMTAIAKRQSECMMKGFAYLKPMTMREIAEELDIHESTVSRTVKGKYVQLPFGTVEMRSFFSAGLQTTGAEDVSAKEVKNEIRMLIDMEDKKKPYSDQYIADTLQSEKSIILSRRTVAKYREQMKIPSSTKRKRF